MSVARTNMRAVRGFGSVLLASLLLLPGAARAQPTGVLELGYNLGPVPANLTNAIQVGVLGYTITALRADGSIAEWGNGSSDPGVDNLVYFSSSWSHAIGQRADGTITGLGDDSYGELSGFPADLTNVAVLVAGTYVTFALLPDGSLIGRGDTSSHALPLPPGATNVVSVASVEYESLLLRADGTVLEWNYFATNSHPELTNVVAIASDGFNGAALLYDGTAVAWPNPAPDGLTNITALAGGGADFLVLRADGTATGWGCSCHGAVDIPASYTNVTAIAIGGEDGYTESAFLIGLPPPPPPVLSIDPTGSGVLRLRLDGLAHRHYVLEEATDLISGSPWQFKQNLVLATSNETFDLSLVGDKRSYRARLLP